MPAPRAIHLTAGLHHPAAATAPFWASLFDDLGISVATFEDIDAGCAALAARPHDLLVVSALRWSMTNDEKYAVHRDQWGYDIPSDARAAITAHLARGGALLAMHAATLCFDTWPQWEEIVGGRWVWGQSGHPPYGPVSTRVVAPDHPLNTNFYKKKLMIAGDVTTFCFYTIDDTTLMFSGYGDGLICCWDVASLQPSEENPPSFPYIGHTNKITHLEPC